MTKFILNVPNLGVYGDNLCIYNNVSLTDYHKAIFHYFCITPQK